MTAYSTCCNVLIRKVSFEPAGQPYIAVVAEQLGDGPFNRGALLNAAFLEARRRGVEYVALHDVDALPLPRVDYSMPDVGGSACALFPISEI